MFLVIEIQTNADNTVGTLVTQHETMAQAENKYYTVLAYAAISDLPMHAAMLCYSNGNLIMSKCFSHGDELDNG